MSLIICNLSPLTRGQKVKPKNKTSILSLVKAMDERLTTSSSAFGSSVSVVLLVSTMFYYKCHPLAISHKCWDLGIIVERDFFIYYYYYYI